MTATAGWREDSLVTSSISMAWAAVPLTSAAQAALERNPSPMMLDGPSACSPRT